MNFSHRAKFLSGKEAELGPCDSTRFASLDDQQRELLLFEAEFSLSILKKRPYQFEALQLAANSLTSLGYYHDGLVYDRRLTEVRPNDPVVTYNLACSLALTGDNDAALACLENAICLGYNDYGHLEEDADLEKLRADPRFETILQMAKKYTNNH